MRYKLQSLWLLLVVILGSVSCSKSNELNEPKLEKKAFLSTEFSTELSDEEAIKQAQSLYSIIGAKDGFRSASLPRVKNVLRSKNSEKLRSSEGDASSEAGLVVVNFENDKGFVLLSDDKLSEPLLGFSDKGNLEMDSIQNLETKVLLASIGERSRYYARSNCRICGYPIPASNEPITIRKIWEFPCTREKCFSDERRRAKIQFEWDSLYYKEYGEYEVVLHRKPLIPVEWDQGKPHNTKLDRMLDESDGKMKLPPVGCVATAMSQIMSYHRYPTQRWGKSIDWDRLINDTYSSYSADILATLHQELGYPQFLHMDYDLDGSGAPSENVPRTFRAYGYKSGGVEPYNWAVIKKELNNLRPLYIGGSRIKENGDVTGHAWVLDGLVILERWVYVRERSTKNIVIESKERREFVHCNFGWGWGDPNGYYFSKAFNTRAGSILDNKLNIEKDRDSISDTRCSKYTFGFEIIKNISR